MYSMTIHSFTPLTKLVLYWATYGLWQVPNSAISAWMSESSSFVSSRSIWMRVRKCLVMSQVGPGPYMFDGDQFAGGLFIGLVHLSKAPAYASVSKGLLRRVGEEERDILPNSSKTW